MTKIYHCPRLCSAAAAACPCLLLCRSCLLAPTSLLWLVSAPSFAISARGLHASKDAPCARVRVAIVGSAGVHVLSDRASVTASTDSRQAGTALGLPPQIDFAGARCSVQDLGNGPASGTRGWEESALSFAASRALRGQRASPGDAPGSGAPWPPCQGQVRCSPSSRSG